MCQPHFSDARKKITDMAEPDGNKIMEENLEMVELPDVPV